jgi:hypothetical protein
MSIEEQKSDSVDLGHFFKVSVDKLRHYEMEENTWCFIEPPEGTVPDAALNKAIESIKAYCQTYLSLKNIRYNPLEYGYIFEW